jgi:hypothetical protein
MTRSAEVNVETTAQGSLVNTIDGEDATYTEIENLRDKYKVLLGDGQARVSLGVDERVSGPHGTYSSVSVRVSVTLSCDQSEEGISKASDLAIRKASSLLDQHLPIAVRKLRRHLRAIAEENS